MLALTHKGMEKEKAYRLAQSLAMEAWNLQKPLKGAVLSHPEVRSYLTAQDIESCFDHMAFLKQVPKIFKRAGL